MMSEGQRTATLFQGIKMVLSAFIGIRKQDPNEEIRVTPLQVIITGLIAAALFGLTVSTVVRLVLSK
jgi:hypothetical protein